MAMPVGSMVAKFRSEFLELMETPHREAVAA
jgi:hypothetical protein